MYYENLSGWVYIKLALFHPIFYSVIHIGVQHQWAAFHAVHEVKVEVTADAKIPSFTDRELRIWVFHTPMVKISFYLPILSYD